MQTKCIFSAKLARQLLKSGERIVDIKPHKTEVGRSVFVFEMTDTLINGIERYNVGDR